MSSDTKTDRYLFAIVLLSIIYFSYWIFFENYRFVTFQSSYYDLGIEVYSFYWHLHGLQNINILQYMVFSNHLCPFCLLITPVFAIYQQPITLFAIQGTVLALTTVVVYVISKDLLKNKLAAFALAFAFLINPGLRGALFFDFHAEAFIPIFYILSFYFYLKGNRKFFVISYLLLLSIAEVSYAVGFAMLLGLLLYEYFYNGNGNRIGRAGHRERMGILLLGFLLTFLAFLFYSVAASYIINTYATASYASQPPITKLINYMSGQLSNVLNPSDQIYSVGITYNQYLLLLFGLVAVFIGFGLSTLRNPILSVVILSPWLVEVLLAHNYAFVNFYMEYYLYVIGGSLLSAILGFLILSKQRAKTSGATGKLAKNFTPILYRLVLTLSVLTSLIPIFSIPVQIFPAKVGYNYTQVESAIETIPSNASVLAQPPIATHLFYIRQLEPYPVNFPIAFLPFLPSDSISVHWFAPEYIIVDGNLSEYTYFNDTYFNISNFTENNYTIYYEAGGLTIFEKK